MKFVELKKSLKDGVLSCYVLKGDDIFLIYKSLELISNASVSMFPDFNKIVFGENASYSASDVLSSCLSMPIGGDRRLVIVKDCSLKASVENVKSFEDYLKNPPTSTTLVFVCFNKCELVEKLQNATVVDCNYLAPELVLKLVSQTLAQKNKKISTDAIEKLCEYCLYNLARIFNELDKLVFYVGDRPVIEAADVENNVTKEVEFQAYEFAQSVASKNEEKAFNILNNLLVKKDSLGLILNSLYSQFSRMFFVSISKYDNAQMAKMLGIKEFAVKKTKELAAKFKKITLKNILELILETEYKMKSGEISGSVICENLVLKILEAV